MKHIQSVNEFFDFFKKDSEEDKIALTFINRLKKVKDINPYKIEKEVLDNNAGTLITYKVEFEDTPIEIKRIKWKNDYDGKYEDGYTLRVNCIGDKEPVLCKDKYLEQLFELVDKIHKDDTRRKRINKINTEINPAADLLEATNTETEIIFKHKRNPSLEIKVTKTRDGRITNIENETGIRFPFSIGQLLQRNVETWACNNNFLMHNKDTCPEKKIFGVRTKDVPQGHEWRHIYPNKF